jgi:hypothetical protein
MIMKRLRLWILLLPFALYFFGVGLNILVITANHGTMPVVLPLADKQPQVNMKTGEVTPAPEAGDLLDDVHRVYISEDIHLAALCDWIQVRGVGVVSPGDCLLWLGDWMTYPFVGAWFALLLFRQEDVTIGDIRIR